MPDKLLFEHPLSERMRLMLRLEHLFHALDQYQALPEGWRSRELVYALLDIRELVSRADVKGEVGKELDRHIHALAAMRGQERVDQTRLEAVLSELDRTQQNLQASKSEGRKLFHNNALLKAIEQRYTVPGGVCSFDVPAFKQWLYGPDDVREHDLQQWLGAVQPLREAISTSLQLSRNSAQAEPVVAEQGSYQRTLPSGKPPHLIRLRYDAQLPAYPEVSGNNHLINIRFIASQGEGKGQNYADDIAFELTCCLL